MSIFYNYSKENFTCTWGKVPYTFEAGKVYEGIIIADNKQDSVMLTDSVIDVFAHHLATKVMDSSKEFTKDMQLYTLAAVELLKERAKALPEVETVLPPGAEDLPAFGHSEPKVVNEAPDEVVVAEVPETLEVSEAVLAPKVEKKKAGRPKKTVEPKFAGIDA